ncbi:MAG: hypothetical protein NTW28_11820, partial [Candidatus Solibacter sp.]|nr:hypothetical protein [Candidatus Solibacter sp.]
MVGADHFGVAFDDGEQVIEVVRDAAGQLSHGLQFLRLPEFLLKAFAFGDIGGHHQRSGDIAELDGMRGNFDDQDGAIFFAVPPWTVGVGCACGSPGVFEQRGHILRRPNVAQGHAQEFLARVAIACDCSLV